MFSRRLFVLDHHHLAFILHDGANDELGALIADRDLWRIHRLGSKPFAGQTTAISNP